MQNRSHTTKSPKKFQEKRKQKTKQQDLVTCNTTLPKSKFTNPYISILNPNITALNSNNNTVMAIVPTDHFNYSEE